MRKEGRRRFTEQFPVAVFTCLTMAVLLITAYRSLQGAGTETEEITDAAELPMAFAEEAFANELFSGTSARISSDAVPESGSVSDLGLSADIRAGESGEEESAEEEPGEEGPVEEEPGEEGSVEEEFSWEEPVEEEPGVEEPGEEESVEEGSVEEVPDDFWDETKRVALTFDDGPHPVYTVELLDGLAERGVCATFFVIGENIPGNEEIIRRMDMEGHLIGNHTYDHVKISDLSVEEACGQVEKTSALIHEITGKDTEYVRPPFGSWRKDLECSFEMFPVLWDVDPLDWTTKNTSDVVRRVLEAVGPDDIILLHDCYKSSVEAALQIVDALSEQGYEFVTVDELILE